MLQSMRIIGLLKDLISNWLLICLKLFKAYLSVTLNFGNTGMMGSVALFLHHWNVAIFRKIRVELNVLRATYNRLPRDLFQFSDGLGPSNRGESQFAKF